MSKIGKLWNALANPDRIPKLYSLVLAAFLLVGFLVPISLDTNQIYPRPVPQEQVDEESPLAPYDRGGKVLKTPGIIKAQYSENSKSIGMITSYMSPQAILVQSISPYFGTSIYSSPGGLIDEVLYYSRGFDTILESTILMMSFVIASWLVVNFTMNTRRAEKDSKNSKKANIKNINISKNISKIDSSSLNKEEE
ncbi:hypothetical protein ALNOE001_06950 [Candidatus Methanobinarius endosymbioticus]|uniref:Uncharacterized protein n=1 Tax=Candidatus Methanobinarius endosymbioticus TaxID=2006182 RepID=A0A366MC45_9EURY|nr:hypothetical protein ALNOE001_06950 [Candidatus Methanobinarius endosymbioticus]